jgi:hypothetical protein
MSFSGWLDAALVGWAVAHLVAIAFLTVERRGGLPGGAVWAPVLAVLAFAAGGGVARWAGVARVDVLVAVGAGWVLAVLVMRAAKGLSPAGGLAWSSFLLMGSAVADLGAAVPGVAAVEPGHAGLPVGGHSGGGGDVAIQCAADL